MALLPDVTRFAVMARLPRAARVLVLGPLTVVVVACNADIVDNWPTLALAGHVRDPEGAAKADHHIRVELRAPDCATGSLQMVASTRTDAAGRYLVTPTSPGDFVGCVRVRVTPRGYEAQPTTVEREGMTGRSGWPAPDTIVVDVVLP